MPGCQKQKRKRLGDIKMDSNEKSTATITVEYANGKYAVNSFEDGEVNLWQNNIDDEFELMLCLEWVVSDLDVDYSAVTVPLRVIERPNCCKGRNP